MSRYSNASKERLATVHPVLQLLFNRAMDTCPVGLDWSILCGFRGEADQNKAYSSGHSKLRWPNSKHNSVPSRAVDAAPYVNGSISWDWKHYYPVAAHVKATWAQMSKTERGGFTLSWGGDWKKPSEPDGPHWELVK